MSVLSCDVQHGKPEMKIVTFQPVDFYNEKCCQSLMISLDGTPGYSTS